MSPAPQFENTQIDVSSLPRFTELKMIPMESRYKLVRMLAWAVMALILTAVGLILIVIFKNENLISGLWITAGVYFIIFVFSFLVSYFGYYQMAYALRERDILFKKGWIFRKTTIVPFERIQHCEVNRGPIDRYFGLASLKVFTAGGSASDLSIPGLTEARAHQLKDFITKKTGIDEEE